MNIPHILAACLLALPATAAAVDVNNTAGALSDAGLDADISALTVTGTVNAADFEYIAHSLTKLQTLDLSQATIAEYSGDALLTGIRVSPANTVPANALFGSPVTSVTLPLTATAIGDNAFAASAITSVTIPASVTTVGESAFAGCKSLTTLTLPAATVSLGQYLAYDCTALTSVTVNGAVATVPSHAFAGCTSLKSVSLRPSLGAIGDYAFSGCSALSTFSFPSSLRSIGDYAFDSSGLTRADMTASVGLTNIGEHAFGQCASLQSVVLPESVTTIGAGAFFMDKSLTEISIPTGVTVINDLAFAGLSALTDPGQVITADITTIGAYGVARMSAVDSVVIPASVTSIGDNAMERWTALKTINATTLKSVPLTGAQVWEGINPASVTLKVGEDYADMFREAAQWQDFDIQAVQMSVEIVTDDTTGAQVRMYFVDRDINVVADTELELVSVYNTSGILLARLMPADTAAVISTDGLADRYYIVQAIDTEGRVTTAKLAR